MHYLPSGNRNEMNHVINSYFLWNKIFKNSSRKQMNFPKLSLALQFCPDIEILSLFYTFLKT